MSNFNLCPSDALTIAGLQFAIEARYNDDFNFDQVATYGERLFTDPKNHAESWVRAFMERLWHEELEGGTFEAARQAHFQGIPLEWLMENYLEQSELEGLVQYLLEEGASPYELSQELQGTKFADLVEVHLVDDEGEPIDD